MSWKELENRTLWDITTNGSPLELVGVAVACLILAPMYAVIRIFYWVKYR